MQSARFARSVAVAFFLSCSAVLAAEPGDGALLKFEISSTAPTEAGKTNRAGLQGTVLVAFNERFAVQSSPFRIELTAVELSSSAGVTVTLFDVRAEPPALIGTEHVVVPLAGSGIARMTGPDGTAYAVSVEFVREKLPVGKT